jgi:hypothetical protein
MVKQEGGLETSSSERESLKCAAKESPRKSGEAFIIVALSFCFEKLKDRRTQSDDLIHPITCRDREQQPRNKARLCACFSLHGSLE